MRTTKHFIFILRTTERRIWPKFIGLGMLRNLRVTLVQPQDACSRHDELDELSTFGQVNECLVRLIDLWYGTLNKFYTCDFFFFVRDLHIETVIIDNITIATTFIIFKHTKCQPAQINIFCVIINLSFRWTWKNYRIKNTFKGKSQNCIQF